ncbi:hypothetical protein CEXT_605821 [Caerostris extrusa]|uniref:Uncharacterized protein n=1 Tax=Caerostris extrusa TaxID=172846 RepID=A0AAV4W670_CAEEX|nr:hypothetical protein CEXT_605821 [Caerostris extrusa]
MEDLIEYGIQNPNPFKPDMIPFITEHFQETSSFHPNTSYMADSENSFYSDKSVAAKEIIDAQVGSNNAHLQSDKVNAEQNSPFTEQNGISYVNNGFLLSSNTSKSSTVISVKNKQIYMK